MCSLNLKNPYIIMSSQKNSTMRFLQAQFFSLQMYSTLSRTAVSLKNLQREQSINDPSEDLI